MAADSKSDSKESDVQLKREVGLLGVVGFLIGGTIGSGIFISPKAVLRSTHSVGLCLVVWVLCGFLSVLSDLCTLELALIIRKSGGSYIYFFVVLGPIWGYLRYLLSVFIMNPSGGASQCLSCANYMLSALFTDGCVAPWKIAVLTATAVMLTLCVINIYSVRFAVNTQIFFTVAKLSALGVICIGGVVRLAQGYTENFQNAFEGSNTNPWELVMAFYGGLWPYFGSASIIEVFEEVKNPSRNIVLGFVISMSIITSVYLLVNVSYFTAMTPEELLASNAVATTWAEEVIPAFAWLMPLSVAMSVFGSQNGLTFGQSRSVFVPAREGHLPSMLSMIHVTRWTPVPALTFYSFTVIIFVVVGDSVENLISWLSFTNWLTQGVLIAMVIYMQFSTKWRDAPRVIKPPLVIHFFMLAVSAYFVVGPLVANPSWGYFSAFIVAGVAVITYWPFVIKKMVLPGTSAVTEFFQLLLQVAPSTSGSLKEKERAEMTTGNYMTTRL